MDLPSLPVTSTLSFAYEVGYLKRLPRTGWQMAGVIQPESVAEHSFRVGVLAFILAAQEGGDPDRAATLGLFHDVPEARTGDVVSIGKHYVTTLSAHEVVRRQVAGIPEVLARHIVAIIDEHEMAKTADATLEARCSKDADKLECLLQAREYEAAGNPQLQPWISSMTAALQTESAQRLAEATKHVSPSTWWARFASTHLPEAGAGPEH